MISKKEEKNKETYYYKYGKCQFCKSNRIKEAHLFEETSRNCNNCKGKKLIKGKFVIEYVSGVIIQRSKGTLTMSCRFLNSQKKKQFIILIFPCLKFVF